MLYNLITFCTDFPNTQNLWLYFPCAATPAVANEEQDACAAATAKALEEKAKGKAPKIETADDSDDGEEEDFEADYEDSDDDSDGSSSSEDDDDKEVGDEDELDDLAAEAGEAGPSSGSKRKRKLSDEEPTAQILEGLSGDEVDPSLIVAEGRRRGRGGAGGAGPSKPKYTAAAQVDSDEDEW